MLSVAGRSYSKTKVVSPYKTAQRFRYYQLDPITARVSPPKHHGVVDNNLRGKTDSFMLRYNKDIMTNTDHSPSYHTIDHSPRRQVFEKG